MPARSLCLAKLHKIVLVCLFLAPFCAAADHWDYEESRSEVRDFVAGGMIHVRLSVGDLRVCRGNSNEIRVHYTVKSRRESHVKDAHLDFDVHGNNASLEFRAPTSGNTQFDVELEVPQSSNLDIHAKVGDVTVREIEGDKDVELGVGDIRIISDRSSYHLVRASTGIGDVNSDTSGNEVSGWLGKTLKYHGDGKFELHAHVGVGDITLENR